MPTTSLGAGGIVLPGGETLATHGAGWFNAKRGSLLTRTGITAAQAAYLEEDFTDVTRWTVTTSGSGSQSFVSTIPGGVRALAGDSGTAVGSTLYLLNGGLYPTGGSTKFGAAFRFRISSTPDQYTVAVLGATGSATSAASGFYLGCAPAVSTTHFCFVCAGGALGTATSTIAQDSAWHDGMVWMDGSGNQWGAIDSESPVQFGVNGAPNTAFNPMLAAWKTNAGGNTVTLQIDKGLWIFDQAA